MKKSVGRVLQIVGVLAIFMVLMNANTFYHELIVRTSPELTMKNGEHLTNGTDGTVSITDNSSNVLASVVDDGSVGHISVPGLAGYTQADYLYRGVSTPNDSMGFDAIKIKMYNKNATTAITANALVQIDTARVKIAADTTKANRLVRIHTNFQYGLYGYVEITRPAHTAVDTIRIWGKNPAGTAISESVIGPAGSQYKIYSKYLYSDVDSMRTSITGNTGNYLFYGYYYNTVLESAGANTLICGVTQGTIAAAGGSGWVTVSGLARCSVDAATLSAEPGRMLKGASGGDAVTVASALADTTANGKIIGYCVQPGFKDNTMLLINFCKQ